jgi:inorganic phosphate transporter, PiT family
MLIAILLATLILATANGANDNIKGAATLLGSGLIGYRAAIWLATAATALGGIVSIVVANGLIAAFSGKGIVPQEVIGSPEFLLSVGLGAGLTVALASAIGMPISTTHALLGALVGAGLSAATGAVALGVAFRAMALPLIVSPLIAFVLALAIVPLIGHWRRRSEQAAACACVDTPVHSGAVGVLSTSASLSLGSSAAEHCQPAPGREVLTLSLTPVIDRMHLASAAAVSFARGLNDSPKIAALMVAGGALGAGQATLLVVVAMALGGLFAAGRVADTMAFRVTRMDAGQGLGANLVTSALVIVASRFGVPVSTTHVSTGALFGLAASRRDGDLSMIRNILLAWLLTLPLAALLAYFSYLLIH